MQITKKFLILFVLVLPLICGCNCSCNIEEPLNTELIQTDEPNITEDVKATEEPTEPIIFDSTYIEGYVHNYLQGRIGQQPRPYKRDPLPQDPSGRFRTRPLQRSMQQVCRYPFDALYGF